MKKENITYSKIITISLLLILTQIPISSAIDLSLNKNPLNFNINSFLYTGKEKDSTGLYYYGARYYDTDLMTFITPDQNIPNLYNPQDLNRYSYVRNNPYKYVDPDGEFVDTALDIAFIVSDIAILIDDPSTENAVALGLDVAGAVVPFATGLGKVYKIGKATKVLDKASDVAKVSEKGNDVSKTIRDPRVKSEFLKKEAQRSGALQKYGPEGVEAMKKGKTPDGFEVHHKEPLYTGGKDIPSNLEIKPKGSGPQEHPGTHHQGGETYEKYGPPQQYKKQKKDNIFVRIFDKVFGK